MPAMKTLTELIHTDDPALPLIQEWVASAGVSCEILPAGPQADEVLLGLQVSTRSPLGAIAHGTGGLLIDHGWLRVLGSGHPRLPRDLLRWNHGRADGFLLVADDAAGGFFALDGGAFGGEPGTLHYCAPDTLTWEALDVGYTDFVQWALSERRADFYADLRWAGWEADAAALGPDEAFSFYPFLWSAEGSAATSSRRAVPVAELYGANVEQRAA